MKWLLEEKYSKTKLELDPAQAEAVAEGERQMIFEGDRCYTAYVSRKKSAVQVWLDGRLFEFNVTSPDDLIRQSLGNQGAGSDAKLVAKMPGKVLKVLVKPGDKVDAGKPMVVLEAMKMENHLHVNNDVEVDKVVVEAGQVVETGQDLVTFK